MIRFLSVYLLLAVAGMVFLELPMLDNFYPIFGAWLATTSGMIIHLFDPSITVAGAILSQPKGGFSIEVTTECQALEITWLYCAAILSWSGIWKYKLLWVILGIIVVQILNIIRLISLIYLGQWYPDYFTMIHENFYPLFFGIMVILLFWQWVLFSSSSESDQ